MTLLPILAGGLALCRQGQPPQNMLPSFTVSMKDTFSFEGLRYHVLSVREGIKDYVQKYDQRQSRLTPQYPSDRLAVVELEVVNPSTVPAPLSDVVPALNYGQGSMTDRAQWDIAQRSFVRTDNRLQQNIQDSYSNAHDPVMVGPAGRVKMSLIFSLPSTSRVQFLSLQPGKTVTISGALQTMLAEGQTVRVNLVP